MLITSLPLLKTTLIPGLKVYINTIAIISDILLIPDDPYRVADLVPLKHYGRYWIAVNLPLPPSPETTDDDPDEIIKSLPLHLLDAGATRIVFRYSHFRTDEKERINDWIQNVIAKANIPADRVALWLDIDFAEGLATLISELFNPYATAYLLGLQTVAEAIEPEPDSTPPSPPEASSQPKRKTSSSFLSNMLTAARIDGKKRHVALVPGVVGNITTPVIAKIHEIDADLVLPHTAYSNFEPTSAKIDFGAAFAACLVTDRKDGMIPTVVADEHGIALGMTYSSAKSISEAVRTGKGVYQSRTRGLWRKGATSGAYQELYKIDPDCDRDSIRFTVHQNEPGFCHLQTRTCYGIDYGITGLDAMIRHRKTDPPEGSYTNRLFGDSEMLASKIMEEAGELASAVTPEDVSAEAADLIYFILVKCTSAGVKFAEVERDIDAKSKMISRRPGNAKPFWNKVVNNILKNDSSKSSSITDDIGVLEHDAQLSSGPSASQQLSELEASPSKDDFKMKSHIWGRLSTEDRARMFARPIMSTEEVMSKTKSIVDDVRKRGDVALLEMTHEYDGVQLTSPVIKKPFGPSMMALSDTVKAAIDLAFDNITKFHTAQLSNSTLSVTTMPGVVCQRFARPIEKVGLYVPGGTAVLPSTALMLGIPAAVAGCSEIVIATPPRKDGSIAPEVVYVADKIGAKMIVCAGGAQAIAAMAYGTKTVPKVDKICGPGNQYVTAAKMLIQNDISALLSIDIPAGPSEVLVIADGSSNPAYVASDLLSQAEHGNDSQVVLVAVSLTSLQLSAIEEELVSQGAALPRAAIICKAIKKSFTICVDSMEEALEFSNSYAPEHLIMHVADSEKYLSFVKNAGSVFLGPWSPECCGDYASGTNHTLPTYGFAKMYSGVSTSTFLKYITSQNLTAAGLDALGDTVMTLAECEGLEAHKNAIALRLKDIRMDKALKESAAQ